MDRHRFYTVGLVILLLAIGANTYIGLHANNKTNHVEETTCRIQARGLKAGPHLTKAMQDIGVLLTPLPGVKSAPIPAPLVLPLANLREELGAYVQIEHEQPPGRSC